MSLPVVLTSDMVGSPDFTAANGSLNALLHACLVNGFNTQSVVSATASGGLVTFNFASSPGFAALDAVTVAGASNGAVNGKWRVDSAGSNQVHVQMPGVPDGAVGGTITLKYSPLGWTRPYSGTGIGCYQQGGTAAHKRFLRVYDNTNTTTNRFYARGYEAMTAVSTGTGPFPTTGQVGGNGCEHVCCFDPHGSSTPRPWIVVGTPRFCYLSFGYSVSPIPGDPKLPLSQFLHSQAGRFMFGELASLFKPADVYGVVLPSDYGNSGFYIARNAAGASGAKTTHILSVGSWGSLYPSTNAQYPSGADGGMHFVHAALVLDADALYSVRGVFPGMLQTIESPMRSASALPQGTIFTGIEGVTGRVMVLDDQHSPNGCLGLLLDEDWGDF